MGNQALEIALHKCGLRCVDRTTETEPRFDDHVVEKATPYTHDTNNGVTVVYDGEGCAWIHHKVVGPLRGFGDLVAAFNLKRGAYVPHSNDGGQWVREFLPDFHRSAS